MREDIGQRSWFLTKLPFGKVGPQGCAHQLLKVWKLHIRFTSRLCLLLSSKAAALPS